MNGLYSPADIGLCQKLYPKYKMFPVSALGAFSYIFVDRILFGGFIIGNVSQSLIALQKMVNVDLKTSIKHISNSLSKVRLESTKPIKVDSLVSTLSDIGKNLKERNETLSHLLNRSQEELNGYKTNIQNRYSKVLNIITETLKSIGNRKEMVDKIKDSESYLSYYETEYENVPMKVLYELENTLSQAKGTFPKSVYGLIVKINSISRMLDAGIVNQDWVKIRSNLNQAYSDLQTVYNKIFEFISESKTNLEQEILAMISYTKSISKIAVSQQNISEMLSSYSEDLQGYEYITDDNKKEVNDFLIGLSRKINGLLR